MLTTGMRRVFEIGRTFRDEPADPTHSPEYSLIEMYQAGADYRALQATARDLILAAARAATGKTVIRVGGTEIDLAAPWPVISFHEAVSTAVGEEITPGTSPDRLRVIADRMRVAVRSGAGADDIVQKLYDRLVEPATVTPTFYADFPAGPSPLALECTHDRRLAQKWDLVIGGREIATAYTEQADTGQLRRRLAPDGDRILPSEAVTLDASSPRELAAVIAQAVRIHAIGATREFVFDPWAITNIGPMAARVGDHLDPRLRRLVDQAITETARIDRTALPEALIHGDLTKGNVLIGADGEATILDFAVANRLPRVQELAAIAANLTHGSPEPVPARVEDIAAMYSAAAPVPLTMAEHDPLRAFGLAATAMELLGALQEWHGGNHSTETQYLISLGMAGLRGYLTAT